ncbi:MAG: LysM peptidoglycan-binding domain-containing protein, partial [Rhodanobacter sp.]
STDEDGNTTKTVFNALGAAVETIDGTGAISYVGYDALGNKVAAQDGNGNITFTNVDALGRAVQTGEFVLAAGGASRQAVWQQAYVLDQNGDRIISYDGIGSAYLQTGDTTDAALHATYDGYDSQGRVIWSQDAAQHAASTAADHQNYAGNWTQTPTNANFSQGMTGWTFDSGYSTGSYGFDGQVWPLMFSPTDNPNNGTGGATNNDRVPVVPGQSITANGQFDVLSDHGNGAVYIEWYDANGNWLSESSGGPGQTAGNGSGVATTTGTAPPGAAYASIAIGCCNYNEGFPGVVCSGVWWNYVPPAGTTVLGTGNTGAVVTLPTGVFTDQATNTNFDQGDTGWDTNGWTIHQANNAASGWEASYGGNGTAVMVNQDRVPVTPGQTISATMELSLYLAPDGAAAGGAVAINWYDASGNFISASTGTYVGNDHKGAWETSYLTATAPPGAAYASLAAFGSANGVGSVSVDNVQWNYQYIPQAPTGVVQDTYVYNMDGDLVSETTADGDNETWQYNQYGQAVTHTDLSGATYNYAYDPNTGLETSESDNWSPATQGQIAPSYVTGPINTPNSETLTYEADGQIATENFSDGSSYSYQYDANGNQIREEDTTRDGNNNLVHTVTQTSYDSHNRISTVVETNEVTGAVMLNESFSYDAAGNRREVSATSDGTTQNAWYTYDGDNRVLVSDGSLVNNQIVVTNTTESYENAYDANGNVIQVVTKSASGDTMAQTNVYNAQNELTESNYAVDVTIGATSNGVQQTITYDADGHALVTDTFYALDATINVQDSDRDDQDDPSGGGPGSEPLNVGGELETATVNFYDVVGRLAESQTFGNPSDWDGTASTVPTGPLDPNATTYGSLQYQSEVVYQGPNGTSGYDADGDVVAYQYRDDSGRIDQYQVTYLKKDTYLQADTTGISSTANVQPATDETVYDTRGDEVALEQHTQDPYGNIADTVHVFAYNGNGEIIERQDGTGSTGATLNQGSSPATQVQNYTYVNGQQLAHFDNAGTLDVLDEVTAFSSNNDSPDSYVVQAGDTLQSIAQAEYGNANLWYVLAQANDLDSSTDLVLGQRLLIPAVTTNSNTATTFKPYNPSNITGSTTPNLPTIAPPPPPSSSGCSGLAQVVMIAVEIVVAVVAAPVGGIIVAAMLADAAGQLTGDALGISQGFNVGEVLVAGLTAGIGSEVAEGLQAVDGGIFAASSGQGLDFGGNLIVGAVSYASKDVLSNAVGDSAHFSWVGLVANSVGSGVGGELGATPSDVQEGNLGDNFLGNTAGRLVGDVVDREVSVALGDDDVPSWAQVGEDVAGSALGNASVAGIQGYQAYQLQQGQVQLDANEDNLLATTQTSLNNAIWNGASTDVQGGLSNEGQAALDNAWQQAQGGIDNQLGNVASIGESSSYPSDRAMANYMAGISANPQALLAYAPSGAPGNGANGPMGQIGPPPIISTDGDLIYSAASAASNSEGATNTGSNLFLNITSGSYTTETNGNSLTTIDQEMTQNPDGTQSGYINTNTITIYPVASTDTGNVFGDGTIITPIYPAATSDIGNMYGDGPRSPTPIVIPSAWLPSGLSSQALPPIPMDSGTFDVDSSDLTVSPPPLVVQSPALDIAPIDPGSIQLSPVAPQLPNVSALYNNLASEYQQGEKQINQAGQWINGQEQQREQFLDQLRIGITAYGDSQGAVAGIAGRAIAGGIGVYEGASIGAYKMAAGIVSLANGAAHLASPYSWAMDPQGNMQRVKAVAGTVVALNSIAEAAQINPQLAWTLAKPA